jgi:hypothetical protein
VKEKRFQLFESEKRVLRSLKRALNLSKHVSKPAKNVLGKQPVSQGSPFKSSNFHIDCFLLDLKGLVTIMVRDLSI